MIALGRLELRTITPLVARIKTPPNPSGQASNPYEWRQLQQQLACIYEMMVNIGYANALTRPINHLFMLLVSDEGFLMTIALVDEVVSRAYGAVRSKAGTIVTAMGCGLRCNALDVEDVCEKIRLRGHRVGLPDISTGGESHFVLAAILEYESWKDQVYLRSSRRRQMTRRFGGSALVRPHVRCSGWRGWGYCGKMATPQRKTKWSKS